MGEVLDLDPATSVLLVIDMQNDFCDPAGYYARQGRDARPLQAVIEPTRRLLDRARNAGMPVAYTRLVYDDEHGPVERRHTRTPRLWTGHGDRLRPGSWGAQVVPELRPHPGDLVVDKAGYSAFDGTGLRQWLVDRGIRTLLLSGVVTYACVLATGFAAFDRDFDVVLATDTVGGWDAELDRGTHRVVDLLLGYAIASDQIVFTAGASLVPGTHTPTTEGID